MPRRQDLQTGPEPQRCGGRRLLLGVNQRHCPTSHTPTPAHPQTLTHPHLRRERMTALCVLLLLMLLVVQVLGRFALQIAPTHASVHADASVVQIVVLVSVAVAGVQRAQQQLLVVRAHVTCRISTSTSTSSPAALVLLATESTRSVHVGSDGPLPLTLT